MRLVLLDDHQLFLDSFKLALSQNPQFEVVGQATDARQAYPLVEKTRPDLLVSDLMLHDTDGVSVARELKRRSLSTPLMILTMHSSRAFVREALQAGVRGYALKDQPLSEIMDALLVAGGGRSYVAPTLGEPFEDDATAGSASDDEGILGRLSRREREVFCRIIDGQASREIARTLSISLKTVETHRAQINRKLGAHSPADLIRVAALAGLLAGTPESSLPLRQPE
jgi:DNA-binding NarL/FixJ family response regulator